MVNEPIISIIVPVYNAEEYLDSCIQSILNQTVECFELILIDDGSDDNSGVICETWAIEDERIKVIHQDNAGAARSRNNGVAVAKGNYVSFVDADDVLTKDYLEYLYKLLCEYKADIAIGGYKKIYPDEKVQFKYDDLDETEAMSGLEAMEKLLYQEGIMSVPWGMLIKKNIADIVKFPNGKKAEDMGTIYRFFFTSKRVVIGKHVIYNYMQRLTNTVFSTMRERNADYYVHSREMVTFIKKNCPEYIKAAYCRHFSTCFQILSETELNEKIVKRIYKDIKLLQNEILENPRARKLNRFAAASSLVSIKALHLSLIGAYKLKRESINQRKKDKVE